MGSPTSLNRLTKEGSAGVVVFLVALPLCLGIALGSGAPLFGGIISGVVGGIVVGLLSGSQVSVSGPAAGLAVIVLTAIQKIGTYEAFLVVVVLSGVFQLAFSVMRLGKIVDYVPHSVIKGMLAGIGLLIILKQIPHALGRDTDFMGDFKFLEAGGNTMLSDVASAVAGATAGPSIIFLLSLVLLLIWDKAGKRFRVFQLVPGPLVVVAMGIALNQLFARLAPSLHVTDVNASGQPARSGESSRLLPSIHASRFHGYLQQSRLDHGTHDRRRRQSGNPAFARGRRPARSLQADLVL